MNFSRNTAEPHTIGFRSSNKLDPLQTERRASTYSPAFSVSQLALKGGRINVGGITVTGNVESANGMLFLFSLLCLFHYRWMWKINNAVSRTLELGNRVFEQVGSQKNNIPRCQLKPPPRLGNLQPSLETTASVHWRSPGGCTTIINLPLFNVQPPTFNIQPPTFHVQPPHSTFNTNNHPSWTLPQEPNQDAQPQRQGGR